MFKLVIFALVIVKSIESNVIREYPLTADGLQIDLEMKSKDTELWKVQIDVNEQDKIVRLTRSQPQAPAVAGGTSGNPSTVLPTIENRNGIKAGLCPTGYVKRGGFCFADDDY